MSDVETSLLLEEAAGLIAAAVASLIPEPGPGLQVRVAGPTVLLVPDPPVPVEHGGVRQRHKGFYAS